jgi:hypothetical protein
MGSIYSTAMAPAATTARRPPETRLATPAPALVVGTADWEAEELAALELALVEEAVLELELSVVLAEVLAAELEVAMVVWELVEAELEESEVVMVVVGVAELVDSDEVLEVLLAVEVETETVEPSTVKRGRKL